MEDIKGAKDMTSSERFAACNSAAEVESTFAELYNILGDDGFRKYDSYFLSQAYSKAMKRFA